MMKIFDFRSDTITKPTEEMREAMCHAEVGDDVYGEDPTINRLEQLTANVLGKEAALFMPSGTMANLVALLTHTRHGQQVILDELSHIFLYEAGNVAAIAGLLPVTLSTGGVYKSALIEKLIIQDEDDHHAQTGLICLESSHNIAGGVVTPLADLKAVYETAKKYAIPIHMDGARVFNAASFLNCEVKEIAQYTDSIMFCLSKGLAAPVGSMLAGSEAFIKAARKNRKRIGGGMRQSGILAAAGIIAVEKMSRRLAEDHMHIQLLAEAISKMPAFKVDQAKVQTNILMVDIELPHLSAQELIKALSANGILASDITDKRIRFVTHYQLSRADINETIERLKTIQATL
jgi:threonine aldolase